VELVPAVNWFTRRHVDWCAGGTSCELGEHRSHPHTIGLPGAGRIVITRVRTASGREHAEVRLTLSLAGEESQARGQLALLARGLVVALSRVLDRHGQGGEEAS
jgi:hypothetical protein